MKKISLIAFLISSLIPLYATSLHWYQIASPTTNSIEDVEMRSNPTTGWLCGTNVVAYYTIYGWVLSTLPGSFQLNAISSCPDNTAWAVGNGGVILHYTGTMWQQTTSPTIENLNDVYMFTTNNGWAVGNHVVLRYTGSNWSIFVSPGISDYDWGALGGSSSSNFFIGADQGRVGHWTGSSFIFSNAPTTASFTCFSSPPNSGLCWATTTASEILYWNGSQWGFPQPVPNPLNSISMADITHGWAVGVQGLIVQYNGTSWTPVSSPTSQKLNGVSMVNNTMGFAVGNEGTILQYGTGIGITPTSLGQLRCLFH